VHARAATLVARLVRKFESRIELSKGCECVEAKDVLQLLSLGAGPGDQLLAEASGSDADAALDALGSLFEHRFSEEIAERLGLQTGEAQDSDDGKAPIG
jgi:phosphotransferase system HPr (HPr) family protein